MSAFASPRQLWSPARIVALLVRVPLLAIPVALLAAAAHRAPDGQNLILWFGAAFQAIIGAMTVLSPRAWRQSVAPMVITLYLTALSWLWFGDAVDDWLNHFAKAVLVVMPLMAFGYQSLRESGARVAAREHASAAAGVAAGFAGRPRRGAQSARGQGAPSRACL